MGGLVGLQVGLFWVFALDLGVLDFGHSRFLYWIWVFRLGYCPSSDFREYWVLTILFANKTEFRVLVVIYWDILVSNRLSFGLSNLRSFWVWGYRIVWAWITLI